MVGEEAEAGKVGGDRPEQLEAVLRAVLFQLRPGQLEVAIAALSTLHDM
jgi:hypothetical protein